MKGVRVLLLQNKRWNNCLLCVTVSVCIRMCAWERENSGVDILSSEVDEIEEKACAKEWALWHTQVNINDIIVRLFTISHNCMGPFQQKILNPRVFEFVQIVTEAGHDKLYQRLRRYPWLVHLVLYAYSAIFQSEALPSMSLLNNNNNNVHLSCAHQRPERTRYILT